jgi:prepilin-type processing-associated H-X9-DG protein
MSSSPYDPNQPPIPRPSSGTNTGLIIGIVAAVVAIPMFLACLGVLVALLLPAVQAAREAARRMACQNNMKTISLALLNYHDVYGSYPPAYTVDTSGQPLHSWRTLILPFVEQQAIYDQIDLERPWDDPVNLPFSEIEIPAYVCPSTPSSTPADTTYVAVVDASGIFSGSQGSSIRSVSDGTSNTVLVTETDPTNAVNWMSPQDISLQTFIDGGAAATVHTGGCNCAMADGAVIFLSNTASPAEREAMVSKAGTD